MKSLLFLFCLVTFCHCSQPLQLQLKPLPIEATIQGDMLQGASILSAPNQFIWGGSVIKGDDGKYHMFYSTWESGNDFPPFSDSWVLHSKIAYAVSDFPDREFVFQQIVLTGRALDGDSTAWDAQMVHNPHIKRFGDTYYLYFIGSVDPGEQPKGSMGENLNKRNRVQQNQKIGVIAFKHIEDLRSGNFIRPQTPLLTPRTRVKPDNVFNPSPQGTQVKPDNLIVVNPTVVQRPSDGKYLLYFKGNLYDPNWRGVHGVALSDSPLGPFEALDTFVFDITLEDGRIASAEDPYVWYHKKHKKFYAVLKDFSGKITDGEPGLAFLESLDGITWKKPPNATFMKKELLLKSGERIPVHHLERPQLYLDSVGNPIVLYCASSLVNVGMRQDGTSFNVQIPIELVK